MNAAGLLAFNSHLQGVGENLFPATISFGAVSPLPASTGGLKREERLDPEGGGTVFVDTIAFRVRKALLQTPPSVGTQVTWTQRDLTFRFAKAADGGAIDPSWTLNCEALT